MNIIKLASTSLLLATSLLAAACAAADYTDDVAPDAGARTAMTPTGTWAVRSAFALASPPDGVAPLLAELARATDGASDPSAYLVDRIVEQLPDGNAKSVATVLAPYVAAYVHARLDAYAPELVPGLRELATGAARIATRFSTIESLHVIGDGRTQRRIEGVALGDVDIAFSTIGVADPSALTELTVELELDTPSDTSAAEVNPAAARDRLTITRHAVEVPFAAWFRAGFDRAVVPDVVPGATDLATAFQRLVDCPRLGTLIAESIGVGPEALYSQACTAALGVAARRIYAEFPTDAAKPLMLDLSGRATAIDRDGDGRMDAIDGGAWTGRVANAPLGSAEFTGERR